MLPIDRPWILQVLQDLVRIDSINPSLDPAGAGELEIVRYVAMRMSELGLTIAIVGPVADRPSVVVILAGNSATPTLALNAHVDTVEVSRMAAPFSAEIRDGRLYGRGAYDMKGSLAACMGALKALADAGVRLAGSVELHAVADEEHSSQGTYAVLDARRVDAAIVTEPTALQLCLAHKGFVWIDVTSTGRAAHGSEWQLGVDANVRLARFLTRFEEAAIVLQNRSPHPLLGVGSMHAATMQGGAGRSTFASQATAGIERRTLPGESTRDVQAQIERILADLAEEDPTFQGSARLVLDRPPFEAIADSPLAAALDSAALAVVGSKPRRIGENPWMDASLYAERGIDTVVFGASGAGAHADEEWVDVDSVCVLAQCLAETAVRYCGRGDV